MRLEKFLILSAEKNEDYDPEHERSHTVKLRVVRGFSRASSRQALQIQKGWTPKGNGEDNLFMFPGCTVPRVKVREKFNTTIKPSKATACFINPDSLEGSASTFELIRHLGVISFDTIRQWLLDLHDDHIFPIVKSFVDQGISDIHLDKSLWDDCSYDVLTKPKYNASGDLYEVRQVIGYKWGFKNRMHSPENNILAFKKGRDVDNMTCSVYHQDEILKRLNEGNIVIDETKYQELKSFMATGESDNITLAMEIMANSDYNKGLLHILLLIREFGEKMKKSVGYNHVNFKSLLNYLDLDGYDIGHFKVHAITNVLRKHKRFTKANALRIATECKDDSLYNHTGHDTVWQSGITVKPEFINQLDSEDDSN